MTNLLASYTHLRKIRLRKIRSYIPHKNCCYAYILIYHRPDRQRNWNRAGELRAKGVK